MPPTENSRILRWAVIATTLRTPRSPGVEGFILENLPSTKPQYERFSLRFRLGRPHALRRGEGDAMLLCVQGSLSIQGLMMLITQRHVVRQNRRGVTRHHRVFYDVLHVFQGTLFTAHLNTSLIHRTELKKSRSSLTYHHTSQILPLSCCNGVPTRFCRTAATTCFWNSQRIDRASPLLSRATQGLAIPSFYQPSSRWEQRQTEVVRSPHRTQTAK